MLLLHLLQELPLHSQPSQRISVLLLLLSGGRVRVVFVAIDVAMQLHGLAPARPFRRSVSCCQAGSRGGGQHDPPPWKWLVHFEVLLKLLLACGSNYKTRPNVVKPRRLTRDDLGKSLETPNHVQVEREKRWAVGDGLVLIIVQPTYLTYNG